MKKNYRIKLFNDLNYVVFTVGDDFLSCVSTLGNFNYFWNIDFEDRNHFERFLLSLNDPDIPNMPVFVSDINDTEISLEEYKANSDFIGEFVGNIDYFDEEQIDVAEFLLDVFVQRIDEDTFKKEKEIA